MLLFLCLECHFLHTHAHTQIGLSFKLIEVDMQTTTESSLVGGEITKVCQYFWLVWIADCTWYDSQPLYKIHKIEELLWLKEPFSFSGSHYMLPVQKHFFFLTVLSQAQKWISPQPLSFNYHLRKCIDITDDPFKTSCGIPLLPSFIFLLAPVIKCNIADVYFIGWPWQLSLWGCAEIIRLCM